MICGLIVIDAVSLEEGKHIVPFIGYGGTCTYNSYQSSLSNIIGLSNHTLALLSGPIIASIVSVFRGKRYGFRPVKSLLITVLFFLQAVCGVKVLAMLENLLSIESFSELFSEGLAGISELFSFGGMSTFGGLYFSLLFIPLFAKILKHNRDDLFDFFVPSCVILLACARMGCFISGCCGARLMYVREAPLYLPIQLFEVGADYGVLALSLFAEERNKSMGIRKFPPFGVMMVSYSIIRFLLEFIRNSVEVFHSGYSIGQIHCIIFLIIGGIWCLKSYKRYLKVISAGSELENVSEPEEIEGYDSAEIKLHSVPEGSTEVPES